MSKLKIFVKINLLSIPIDGVVRATLVIGKYVLPDVGVADSFLLRLVDSIDFLKGQCVGLLQFLADFGVVRPVRQQAV